MYPKIIRVPLLAVELCQITDEMLLPKECLSEM